MSIFKAESANDVFAYKGKIDIVNNYETPLISSILRNNEEVFEALLIRGANPLYRPAFRTPAIYAIINGNLNMVKKILTKENIDKRQLLERPLNTASRKGHIHIMKWLYDNDVNIDQEDTFSPFYLACQNNKLEAAKLLVEWGVETDFLLYSPLVAASDEGHYDIVEYLLSNDFDFCNREEGLSTACLNKDSKMAELFISYDVGKDELGIEELEFLETEMHSNF